MKKNQLLLLLLLTASLLFGGCDNSQALFNPHHLTLTTYQISTEGEGKLFGSTITSQKVSFISTNSQAVYNFDKLSGTNKGTPGGFTIVSDEPQPQAGRRIITSKIKISTSEYGITANTTVTITTTITKIKTSKRLYLITTYGHVSNDMISSFAANVIVTEIAGIGGYNEKDAEEANLIANSDTPIPELTDAMQEMEGKNKK